MDSSKSLGMSLNIDSHGAQAAKYRDDEKRMHTIMTISQGRWLTLPDMAIARSHSPVVPFEGRLYIFGGGGPDFKSLASVVAYDPVSGRYEDCADMPTARSGTAAFAVGDRIAVIGGGFKKTDGNFQFLRTVELYDPRADRWEQGPDMLEPHDYPAATLHQGQIYILGGHHPEACLGGPKTDPGFSFCERWRPGDAGWERIADLPTPRFAAAAVSDGSEILTCGGVAFTPEGFNNFDFFETYDLAGDRWRRDDRFHLPWPAAGHGLCLSGETLCFFGGYSTDNIHNRAAILTPGATAWQRLADMPLPRAAMGVAVTDKRIYLVGGWADDGRTPLASVIAYEWE